MGSIPTALLANTGKASYMPKGKKEKGSLYSFGIGGVGANPNDSQKTWSSLNTLQLPDLFVGTGILGQALHKLPVTFA
jgi:hypothetical protein